MSSSGSPSTKRACDACHRRKVKCNGINPCEHCKTAGLGCTFNKPQMKKGPKGSRAKVISELRQTQADQQSSSAVNGFGIDSPLTSPTFARHAELLTSELVESSIATFFDRIYPTLPILHGEWVRSMALKMHTDMEAYCLIGSLCAFMVVQPGVQPPMQVGPASPMSSGSSSSQHNRDFVTALLQDVRRRLSVNDFDENPNTATVATSFLVSATYFGLENHQRAWFHLQKAILCARIMRIHDDKSYRQPETPIDMMNRRLFYILFISERAQALQKHRDLTIHETISFPEPVEDPHDVVAIPGLLCLYNLFTIVDDKVSEIWNNLRSQAEIVWPPNTAIWLTRLQKDLTEAMPHDLQVTEVQEVDLKSTQLWLRSIVWQLSTASGCLSSAAHDRSMTFSYPIEIARELVELASSVSVASMEAHGIGFVEKLFDIAFTLIDVMTVVPITNHNFEAGPQNHLARILFLVSNLRGGETRFVGLLHTKIRDSLPNLAATLQLPVAPTPPSNASIDRSLYQESSTGSAASSPYGSPDGSNHAMVASTGRFPPLLTHSHSNPDGTGLTLNIASPLSSSATERTSGPVSAVDATNPYPMAFANPGPGAGFSG